MKKINRLFNFLMALKTSTKFLLGGLILTLFSFSYIALAASLYTPGETLNPTCSPGDANCTVSALAISGTIGWTKSGNNTYTNVSGNIGIGTTNPTEKLHVMDGIKQEIFSDPTLHGVLFDSTNLNGATGVFIAGKYAYVVAQTSDSLAIIDINDPASPTVIDSLIDATNMNGASSVYVSGKYAYVAGDESDSLAIVNVSSTTNPTLAGSLLDSTNMNGASSVFVSSPYVYVTGLESNSLVIVNVSSSTNPTLSGSLIDASNLSGASCVFATRKYAYVGGSAGDSLAVVNISDPTDPSFVSGYANSTYLNYPASVFVSGMYIYIAGRDSDSLAVVDVYGTELTSLDVGAIKTGSLDVDNYAIFNNSIDVKGGINLSGSLLVRGSASFGNGNFVVDESGNVGIGTGANIIQTKLEVSGGVKIGNESTCDSDHAGTMRYYASGNNAYFQSCIRTGTTTYEWESMATTTW